MTLKEKAIKKLKQEYEDRSWRNIDRYEMDFHSFIIEKLVPYLSTKGIKLLTTEYEQWNKQGRNELDY